jgi:serine/threonine protein kinase
MINDYLIIKELGRGVHGKVKLAEDTERGGLVVSLLS